MTREKAEKVLDLPREEAVASILELGEKAKKYDELAGKGSADKPFDNEDDPATPSGMKAPYSKPPGKKRKK